jgi:hypothetical protein
MRRCLAAILVVGLVSLTSRDAAAQPSEKDIVAYAALNATPVGAHTPIMMPKANAFAFRYSRYAPPEGLEGNNNLAGSYFMKAGANALVGATLGYIMPGCDGCEGIFNAGLDLSSTLWSSTGGANVGMSGSFGWANDDGATALSAAIGVPLGFSVEQANKSTFSFFVQPAFGWGRLSEDGASESGTRPIVGAGAAWTAAGGWGVHAAFNKIIIEDGGNSFGVGFSYKLGN